MPVSERFHFHHSPPPVVLDFWQAENNGSADTFTTIGNWRQPRRQLVFRGEVYHWSKHLEFLKFLDVPRRTGQSFELALSSFNEADRQLLQSKGWRVRAWMKSRAWSKGSMRSRAAP